MGSRFLAGGMSNCRVIYADAIGVCDYGAITPIGAWV